ncbi:cell division protein FtsL [Rhodobacteraceae bacterium SC52]|nr:cell division protein FtsL [Rhodobacteraceae bacterium SC52]
MRVMIGMVLGAMVLGLAFWAYQENYRTRQAQSDVRQIQREIGFLQEQMTVLRAEWAYLNRPERLRALSALNFEKLGLLPMTPEHFGRLDQVAYPPQKPILSAAVPSDADSPAATLEVQP